MPTTRLDLYNGACRLMGERVLASVDENVAVRRHLDAAWDDGAVRQCLEAGQWNFAIRTASFEYSPSVEPPFGYRRAFEKPTDWIRTVGLAADGSFATPLLGYVDENTYWFAGVDTIYVRYVSDDAAFGADLSIWPPTFARLVAAYLALEVAPHLTQSQTKADLIERKYKARLSDALSKDALNDATVFAPEGSWVRSRRGGWGLSHRRTYSDGGGLV